MGKWSALGFVLLSAALAARSTAAQPVNEPQGGSEYLAEAARRFTIQTRCEQAADRGEVVVCGRRDEAERYRLPIRPDRFDPQGSVGSVSRERHKLIQEGDAGVGSCSTVGPGGSTGCFHRDTKRRCEQETCGFGF